jgi:predicted DNA-binding transcriptional regulator AlpA
MSQRVLRPVIRLAPSVPPPLPTRKILTVDVLDYLGITRATLDRLRELEDFPKPYRYSAGGRLVWALAELEAWLNSRRVDNAC